MLRDITVTYRTTPIGLDALPRFSWKIESDAQNVMQETYAIIVRQGENVMWDSGKVDSAQSILVEYAGTSLEPMTAYSVEFSVWDNNGELHTGETAFETGLMGQENWQAEWITHSFLPEETRCPVFCKKVEIGGKTLRRARIYATALGVYEITINGKKVSDAFLAPGWTSYHNRLQYQSYDVTKVLSGQQEAVIEITVGNGWYKGYLNGEGEKEFYGDRVALLGMLFLEEETGGQTLLGTDASWEVRTGTICSAEIYHGEMQDFTSCKETQERTCVVVFDASKKVKKIVAQESEPVRIVKRIPAKQLIHTPKGETVIDFGQNMAGLVAVRLPELGGKDVCTLMIRHAEALDKESNFYAINLRSAKATDTYVYGKDMENQTVMPHFTYHGFRYICIEGLEGDIDISRFTACAMHTDMRQTGYFSCDNAQVNQLQSNIMWGQRSNFFDIPTDCPQRDERLGWTGDAQIFCATGSYNFGTALFYQKWLRDVAVESDMEHGVPHLVPNIVGPSVGTAVWGDCATVIPWQLYETYGDKYMLAEQYPLMKLWVEYIRKQSGDSILWLNGFQRGDWLALDAPASRPGLMSGGTDKNLVANVYYAIAARMARDAAKALGNVDEAREYGALYESIVTELSDEYVTKHGRLVTETQTACALLLHFDLLKKEYRDRVTKSLEENLVNHKNHLTTGFVGTAYLCHALTENGKHTIAEEVFWQKDYPGWFYAIEKGATTIWERWNSILPNGDFDESGMNSLNHYSYGAIGDWLYRKIAGINTMEPGYRKILIRPYLTHGMTNMRAALETVYGTVKSEWSCKDGKITVDVSIPANTTAVLILPEKEEELPLGSGNYHYEYAATTSLEIGSFSTNSTVAELLENDKAREVLYEIMPHLKDSPAIGFIKGKTLGELAAMSADSTPQIEQLLLRLRDID